MANGNGYSKAVQTAGVALTLIAMIGGGIWQLGMRPPREEVRRDITSAEVRMLRELSEVETRIDKDIEQKLELILYRLDKIQEEIR